MHVFSGGIVAPMAQPFQLPKVYFPMPALPYQDSGAVAIPLFQALVYQQWRPAA
jgi:hypothetical protein